MTTKRDRAVRALKANVLIMSFGVLALGGTILAANAHATATMELRFACVGRKIELANGSTAKILDAGPFGVQVATLDPFGTLSFDDLSWDAYVALGGTKSGE
jgi:hypothetical protein